MDDTDALELTGLETFVVALLRGGPLVVPGDPDVDVENTGTSQPSGAMAPRS